MDVTGLSPMLKYLCYWSNWLAIPLAYGVVVGAVTLSQNLKENKNPKLKEITEIGKTGIQAAKSGKQLLKKKKKEGDGSCNQISHC